MDNKTTNNQNNNKRHYINFLNVIGFSEEIRKKCRVGIAGTLKTLKRMTRPRYIKAIIAIIFILIVLTYRLCPSHWFYILWGLIALFIGPILNELTKKWNQRKQFLGVVLFSVMIALGGLLSTWGWNEWTNYKEDQAMLIAVATEWKIMDACIDRTKKVIQHDVSTEGGNKLPYIIFPPLNECSYAITHSETVRCNRDLKNALTVYVIESTRLQHGFQLLMQVCCAKLDNKMIRKKFLESFSRKGGPVDDFMYHHQHLGDYLKMEYPKIVRSAEQQVDTEYLEAFKKAEFLFTIEDSNSISDESHQR
jgi:hypothetical protein